jgi:hypothetical protein
MKNLKELTGKIAFLNGDKGFDSLTEKLNNKLLALGLETSILDNLYEQPQKLLELPKFDNLVIFTTGMYPEKLQALVDGFEKLNYVPKVILFASENSAMAVLGTAREYKTKGTSFYFFYDELLIEINWI